MFSVFFLSKIQHRRCLQSEQKLLPSWELEVGRRKAVHRDQPTPEEPGFTRGLSNPCTGWSEHSKRLQLQSDARQGKLGYSKQKLPARTTLLLFTTQWHQIPKLPIVSEMGRLFLVCRNTTCSHFPSLFPYSSGGRAGTALHFATEETSTGNAFTSPYARSSSSQHHLKFRNKS